MLILLILLEYGIILINLFAQIKVAYRNSNKGKIHVRMLHVNKVVVMTI